MFRFSVGGRGGRKLQHLNLLGALATRRQQLRDIDIYGVAMLRCPAVSCSSQKSKASVQSDS